MAANTILGYGRTRTTKTSQFRFIAEKVWREHKLRSRFITSDTGSLWAPIQDLVDEDIVRPLLLPVDPAFNPLPAMRDLREKNVKIGNDPVPGLRTEDGETFAANTQNHYSATHAEITTLLNTLAGLPVEYVYITALEGVGEDDDGPTKKTILGPKVPGKAITEIIPSLVNDCIHMVAVQENGKPRELRAYVQGHPSEIPSKEWPAGLRLPSVPPVLAAMRKKWPNGYFVLTEERGIGELLDFKDEMAKLAAEYTAKLRGEA